jgi:hypothetical protein
MGRFFAHYLHRTKSSLFALYIFRTDVIISDIVLPTHPLDKTDTTLSIIIPLCDSRIDSFI